jgi:8-oxo-dGTP diphosphatase
MSQKPIIALFGGAFNPITGFHFEIAHRLLHIATNVLVVPSQNHRFKGQRGMYSYEHRLNMAKILFPLSEPGTLAPGVSVLDIDPDEGMPEESFGSTFNLAQKIHDLYPGYEIKIVIGSDNLADLGKWYRSDTLLACYEFLVVNRDLADISKAPANLQFSLMPYSGKGSSTIAREFLYKEDYDGALSYVISGVVQYIKEKGIYKYVTGGPELLADGSNYDRNKYEKAANTVDIAIVRLNGQDLEVLLIKRKWNPYQGFWAIPGGFVEIVKQEGLETAAIRELDEETHAQGIPVEQLRTYGEPDRDPRDRVISTVYYALLPQGGMDNQEIGAYDDAKEYQWRILSDEMETSDLAFDHAQILKDLLKVLRKEARYTPLPFSLLPKQFTWKQVTEAYKALLGREPLNVRRKISARYLIKEVGSKVVGARHRPAKLLEYLGEKNEL